MQQHHAALWLCVESASLINAESLAKDATQWPTDAERLLFI
jgi:hypothetical protein